MSRSQDVSRRLVKSFVDGVHLATTNGEIVERAFRKYLRLQREREPEDAYQVLRSFLPRKPHPTIDGFKAVFAELSEPVTAAKSTDPKDFIDTRLLEEMDRNGYIDGFFRCPTLHRRHAYSSPRLFPNIKLIIP